MEKDGRIKRIQNARGERKTPRALHYEWDSGQPYPESGSGPGTGLEFRFNEPVCIALSLIYNIHLIGVRIQEHEEVVS